MKASARARKSRSVVRLGAGSVSVTAASDGSVGGSDGMVVSGSGVSGDGVEYFGVFDVFKEGLAGLDWTGLAVSACDSWVRWLGWCSRPLFWGLRLGLGRGGGGDVVKVGSVGRRR